MRILVADKLAEEGLDFLKQNKAAFDVKVGLKEDELAAIVGEYDALIVRSGAKVTAKVLEKPGQLKAIARAGVGVDNIDLEAATSKGILVLNTAEASTLSTAEHALALLLSLARKVPQAHASLKSGQLEWKKRSQYQGTQLAGKTLGVVGLGAIGTMLANTAESLGMEVMGYDPFLSIEAAWKLSRTIKKASSLERLLAESDFITLHVPQNKDTKGFINSDKFALMKKGAVLLNFARGGLVDTPSLKKAIADGIVSCYVTDFPDEEVIKTDKVIAIPHLGASTEESEENCAIMATMQLMDFLENGNIKNSVNFPECSLDRSDKKRITISNNNTPGMIEKITHLFADNKLNIADMINKSKGNLAYNIIDLEGDVNADLVKKIYAIDGIVAVRVL